MTIFDATAHAMATLSTGGYSTRDASIGAFASPLIEVVAIVFMIVGSLPFVVYIQATNGHSDRCSPMLRCAGSWASPSSSSSRSPRGSSW